MSSILVRRKIEDNFVAYLKSVLDDPALKDAAGNQRIYPTKGSAQLVMPFIVFSCTHKENMEPGALDNNDISHFNASAKLVLVTDSDDEFMGPTSDWHDGMLGQINDALNNRRKQCPFSDDVALLTISGFYSDGDDSALENTRYGDVISLQIFGKG